MPDQRKPLDRVIAKLNGRVELDKADREALLKLPTVARSYNPPAYILREGEPPRQHCAFIMSGFALRQKTTSDGARQIVSLHMAGDFLDLQHLFLNVADHSVQALTRLEVIGLDADALQELVLNRPNVARAMWIDALVDSSIYREWVTNVGRRPARARIAHVLCESSLRMDAARIARDNGFELPLTQEQLADAVGLTPVHVNRTLRDLVKDSVVERDKRMIRFSNWNRVAEVGDFNPLYLRLDQSGQPAR